MALVHCEWCGATIASGARACSRCGAARNTFTWFAWGAGKWLIVGALLGALGVIVSARFHLHAAQSAALWDFTPAVVEPVTLEDDAVSVDAASSRGLPIQLPHAGELRLEVAVLKGEAVNVRLISVVDWKLLERAQGKALGRRFPFGYPDFQANRTTHVVLSGRLLEGAYFVIIENPKLDSVGSPFEVKVKAELRP